MNRVAQIDEPDQRLVVGVEQEDGGDYVTIRLFFGDPRQDPDEVVFLSATGAELLGRGLLDAAEQTRGTS
jgi:hypothetical protein